MARVCLLYLGQIRNPKNVLKLRAELDESIEKRFARASIDRAYLSIDRARLKGTMLPTLTQFQLYIKSQL